MSGLRSINLGFVGAGFIGQVGHLANFAALDGCRLAALAELRPALRKQVADRYGIPKRYRTHHELLADPEIEAVVVVTSRPHTGPIAWDCLQAGKHVLSEKPMAGTVRDAERLAAAAHDHQVCYAVGYMKRYDDGVQRAKTLVDQLVQSGELGRMTFVRSHCFMGESYCNLDDYIRSDESLPEGLPAWPEAPEWLVGESQRDYAWFLNVFSHNTNLIRYFLGGTPAVRHAHLPRRDGGVVVLDWSGVPVTLEVGRIAFRDWDEWLEIYFERGRVQVKTPPALLRNVPAQVTIYRGDQHVTQSTHCEWRWAFRRQAEAFVSAIRDGHEPISSGRDAVEDVKLVEAIWRRAAQHPDLTQGGGVP